MHVFGGFIGGFLITPAVTEIRTARGQTLGTPPEGGA